MTTQELATKIARAIFAFGDGPAPLDKARRIQFRDAFGRPTSMLSEVFLAAVIADAIVDAQADDRKGKK